MHLLHPHPKRGPLAHLLASSRPPPGLARTIGERGWAWSAALSQRRRKPWSAFCGSRTRMQYKIMASSYRKSSSDLVIKKATLEWIRQMELMPQRNFSWVGRVEAKVGGHLLEVSVCTPAQKRDSFATQVLLPIILYIYNFIISHYVCLVA